MLLLTNGNASEIKELIWYEEKSTLFVSPGKKNTFNIDEYSDNYNIYVSDRITPLTNKTKPLIEKQEQERKQEEEQRKRKQSTRTGSRSNKRIKNFNGRKKEHIAYSFFVLLKSVYSIPVLGIS